MGEPYETILSQAEAPAASGLTESRSSAKGGRAQYRSRCSEKVKK